MVAPCGGVTWNRGKDIKKKYEQMSLNQESGVATNNIDA